MKSQRTVYPRILFLFGLAMCMSLVVGCPDMGNQNDNTMDNQNDNTMDNQNDNTQMNDNDNQQVNEPPFADAGDNQQVDTGATVQLDGSDSSDPDGDPLAFLWTQVGGTDVTLDDPTSATPSFTAPNADDTLTFDLSVDDSNGGSDTDSVTINVVSQTVPQLFIANFGPNNNITSYQDPATVNGNVPPDTNLQGAQTQLDMVSDIVVNNVGELIATNFGTPSITVYADAASANGNLEPDGNVQGAATELVQPTSLAINTAEDLLFVADQGSDDIYVYQDTASSTFNGNIAPIRIISSTDLNNPTGINFGANDEIYVANNGNNNILVFANASNLNGDVAPTRIITSAAFTTVFDVYIDDDDNMVVVDPAAIVYTFNNAASLNGNQDPDFTLTVPPAGNLTAVTVDTTGTGYLVDSGNDAIYAYDNITTRNGALNPDRTIQGANTQLDTPIRVFLVE